MRRGWSIDPGEWRELAEIIGDQTRWKSVTLTTNDKHMVPERPGVYAICARPPVRVSTNDKNSFSEFACPVYFGRSETDIRSRFVAHCRSRDPDMYEAKRCFSRQRLRFWYVELPKDEVFDVEAALIKCFGPVTNKRDESIKGKLGPPVPA